MAYQSDQGISFDYISPFNEPQWDWDNRGQEGTPWLNAEIAEVTRLLDADLQLLNSTTKIELPEAAHLRYLYDDASDKPGRDDQIDAFFESSSADYVGDLSSVAHKVAGHSYYSTWPIEEMVAHREKVDLATGDVEFWMTEYCVLEDNQEVNGNGKEPEIDAALYMARVIWADLTIANASAWQWWLAVSPYDYKDGLVYVDKNKIDGAVTDSKSLWALGNFSRFVRPGMKRICIEQEDPTELTQQLNHVMSVSFLNEETNKTVTVLINYSRSSKSIKLVQAGEENTTYRFYVTSEADEENLQYAGNYNSSEAITLKSRSIYTFVEE